MKKLLIKKTSLYNIDTKKYVLVCQYNVNERINFRAMGGAYHILDYYPSPFLPVFNKQTK
jgi:hypothetical protein